MGHSGCIDVIGYHGLLQMWRNCERVLLATGRSRKVREIIRMEGLLLFPRDFRPAFCFLEIVWLANRKTFEFHDNYLFSLASLLRYSSMSAFSALPTFDDANQHTS